MYDFIENFVSETGIRNPPPFAALCGDAGGRAVRRDRFQTVVVGDVRPLSLLANDVVEYLYVMRPLVREGPDATRSGEAERSALLGPGERQRGMGDQLLCGEAGWLAALQDGAGDIRGEKGQAQ